MPNRGYTPLQFNEDAFDLEQAKRGMSAYASIKKRTKKAHRLIQAGRAFLLILSLAVFLFLFYLAMEVIALF
jgi:hypothetical protein